MAKSPEQLRRELGDLRRAFLEQLPDRVQAIETVLEGTLGAGELDRQHLGALFHLAHRLCGSAGIYGYPTVHDAAAAIERAAEGLLQAGGTDEPRQVAELRQLVAALRRAAEAAGAGSAAPE
jgi:HPt (histidine-containing phosphotransfer) domain-containing protein